MSQETPHDETTPDDEAAGRQPAQPPQSPRRTLASVASPSPLRSSAGRALRDTCVIYDLMMYFLIGFLIGRTIRYLIEARHAHQPA